ncbi:MAG: hypothetical protein M3Y87_15530 [Myxococcota bacterium]|nr:hypothetical protein [Myxococcota bacterium]
MQGQTEQQFGFEPGPYRKQVDPLWMRHDRTPGSEDDDLLTPVDPAIGPVISASTNRTKTGWHRATSQQKSQRIALGVVGGLVGGGVGVGVGTIVREVMLGLGLFFIAPYSGAFAAAGGVAGLAVGALALVGLALILRRPHSTFVGKAGLMRYTRGLLFGPKVELLRWDDASELKVQRIRQFVNGVYTGTNYSYIWRDARGKKLFHIGGQYRDENALEHQDPAVFGLAAETSWSSHRVAHFDRMIAQEGVARFQCGRDWIGVGKGFLEIGAKGATERVAVGDTKDIFFEQGVLVIKKKDAKEGMFRSDGVYRFPVAALADFRVFLFVLEEQTGIRFR